MGLKIKAFGLGVNGLGQARLDQAMCQWAGLCVNGLGGCQ